jgi:hypothetical protein
MVRFFAGKKKEGLTEEQYVKIAKVIKDEAPFWSVLETDILVILLKIAMKKYSKDNPAEKFTGITDEELHEKAREAFLNYDTSNVTQAGLLQLNQVYKMGKGMGLKGNRFLKLLSNKMDKLPWRKKKEDIK